MNNWVEVDRYFHYLRLWKLVATVVSTDGEIWQWHLISGNKTYSGTTVELSAAKKEVESLSGT